MVVAVDGFTLGGLIVGFALWLCLFFGVHHWGSSGDE
jgi:hypothetical protein